MMHLESFESDSATERPESQSMSIRSWWLRTALLTLPAVAILAVLNQHEQHEKPLRRSTEVDSEAGHDMISFAASCGPAPLLEGQALDQWIQGAGSTVLVMANPQMRCTQAVLGALKSSGMRYTLKEFETGFQYQEGQSAIWDWLHCSYPNDQVSSGTIMHSYVFQNGNFLGEGFSAAQKVQQGLVAGVRGETCEDRFPEEANVLQKYQAQPSNQVLLFGWLACPCTGIAEGRFAASNLCYEGRTWADPNSRLMAFLQCKVGKPDDHSFVYFRNAAGHWEFKGNGFQFEDGAMPELQLQKMVTSSGAKRSCQHANVKVNVFGTPLQECRTNPGDIMGSWQDDGTCSEQIGGIHEICIEHLPADFSSETHQSPWSRQRADQRHCVCVGAWSLYMTDAEKHPENAAEIMPHCKAIPETALTARYIGNWKDWNGYPANIVEGVGKLVSRCLDQATDLKAKCALMHRFRALQKKAPELTQGTDLESLDEEFSQLTCNVES